MKTLKEHNESPTETADPNKKDIILDLEMTCCSDGSFPKDEMEIIEIGAVKIFHNNIVDEFHALCRPRLHPALTPFCKDLLGISQIDVDSAPSFQYAFPLFQLWCGDCARFASWGGDDIVWLRNECSRYGLDFPFNQFCNLYRVIGCAQPRFLRRHNMQWNGQRHRALNDARTYAQIVFASRKDLIYK